MGVTIPDRDEYDNTVIKIDADGKPVGLRVRAEGIINSTATKNTDTTLSSAALTSDRKIEGVQMILENHVFGDSVSFEVHHPQAGLLDQFGKTWYVEPDRNSQTPIRYNFKASIPANLLIRVVYHSVGTENDVNVLVNAYMFQP